MKQSDFLLVAGIVGVVVAVYFYNQSQNPANAANVLTNPSALDTALTNAAQNSILNP